MKTAKEIMAISLPMRMDTPTRTVEASVPLVDVLPLLLDTTDGRIGVKEGNKYIGEIDAMSMLRGLESLVSGRDDSSIVTIQCAPNDYSASRIATAVEDADAHLVDLWSHPAQGGMIEVNIRVRRDDPSAVVHSLERYGYEVTYATGKTYRDAETTALRLLELNTLLNV